MSSPTVMKKALATTTLLKMGSRVSPYSKRGMNSDNVLNLGKCVDDSQCFKPGQFFFHQVFGYRGVVLFAWQMRLKDSVRSSTPLDAASDKTKGGTADPDGQYRTVSGSNKAKETTIRVENFYAALIHNHDLLHVKPLIGDSGLTGPAVAKRPRLADDLIGSDILLHEDMVPYVPWLPPADGVGAPFSSDNSSKIFEHEMFQKFFELQVQEPVAETTSSSGTVATTASLPPAVPIYRPSLFLTNFYRELHMPYLTLNEAVRMTTNGVRITMMPFFIGFYGLPTGEKQYMWRYTVRMENFNEEAITFRRRIWRMYSNDKQMVEDRRMNLDGRNPCLGGTTRAFQYTSFVPSKQPRVQLLGSYLFEMNGTRDTLEISMPLIQLESTSAEHGQGWTYS